MEDKEIKEELDTILTLAEEFCVKHGIEQLNACVIIYETEVCSSGFSLDKDFDVTRRHPMEDKQKICDLLLPALQATRNLSDLVGLTYDGKKDLVYALFASGAVKSANVAMDSGTAMIKDIVGQVV